MGSEDFVKLLDQFDPSSYELHSLVTGQAFYDEAVGCLLFTRRSTVVFSSMDPVINLRALRVPSDFSEGSMPCLGRRTNLLSLLC